MVKKIHRDGQACAKCLEVEERLAREGIRERIDETLVADERDPDSEGMKLARQHQITRAPFFLAQNEDTGEVQIYTSYLKFLREVLHQDTSTKERAQELLENDQDLDLL